MTIFRKEAKALSAVVLKKNMKKYNKLDVVFEPVADPEISLPEEKPEIPAEIFENHIKLACQRMQQEGLDCLLVYADREHYGNFRYLTGFEPRFEEGVLVLHKDGRAFVLLGNECSQMYKLSPHKLQPVLCQVLSLPNQTMDQFTSMEDCLKQAKIESQMRVGVVDWKLIQPAYGQNYRHTYCAPAFIIDTLARIVGADHMINATGLFISPEDGMRLINTADEIAAYEYGAAMAGQDVLNAVKSLRVGVKETDTARCLVTEGRVLSCHPIVAFGRDAFKGLISPTDCKLEKGDAVSISLGLVGGLTCRNGYAVETEEELDENGRKFFQNIARQYFAAVASWYEYIGIGVTGGQLFDLMQEIIPQHEYGWKLNPGHLIADEEWLSSPVYPGSQAVFKSGMLMQMDIIPSVIGMVSPNMEDGLCIANDDLQLELAQRFPHVYKRMMSRRTFMENQLHISIKKEILPMSNCSALYRPLMLNKAYAFCLRK